MTRHPGILIVGLLCAVSTWNCRNKDRTEPEPAHYYAAHALDSLLLRQLERKKVVLVGDPYEYHRTYLEIPAAFLEFWLNAVSSDSSNPRIPHRMTLALDTDPSLEPVFTRFLETGDRRALMRGMIDLELRRTHRVFYTTSPSIDFVEFLEQVRKIYLRVDSLRHRSSLDVAFQFVAANEPLPYAEPEVRNWSPDDQRNRLLQWRMQEKGTGSARTIRRFLEADSGRSIIVFYENQYLFGGSTISFRSVIHGLDSLIGHSAYSVFQGSRLSRHPMLGDNSKIDPATAIEEYNVGNGEATFVVRKEPKPSYPFPRNLVKSQAQLHAMLDVIESRSAGDSADVVTGRMELTRLLGLLDRSELCLSARDATEISALTSRVASFGKNQRPGRDDFLRVRRLIDRFDAVKDILDVDGMIGKHGSGLPTEYLNSIIRVMSNLPPDSTVESMWSRPPEQRSTPTLTDWGITWRRRRVEIMTYMLVQLLWVGSPNEVAGSMSALRFITRFDYRTPEGWTHWWHAMSD